MPITSVAGVSTNALSLKNLMDGVVDRLTDRFNYHNVTLPSKIYWKVGAPVIDCEQLVLSVDSMFLGPPGNALPQPVRSNAPRSVVFRAMIARQIPVVDGRGYEPSGAVQQEASEILAVDMWVLLDSVAYLDAWDAVGAFGLGVVADVQFEEPQGGYQVITATFTMAVP
jgi:hypothetical protein